MNSLIRKQFTLRLSEEIFERLRREADKLGISLNAYLTMKLSGEIK